VPVRIFQDTRADLDPGPGPARSKPFLFRFIMLPGFSAGSTRCGIGWPVRKNCMNKRTQISKHIPFTVITSISCTISTFFFWENILGYQNGKNTCGKLIEITTGKKYFRYRYLFLKYRYQNKICEANKTK
jgi:hypothetical protein